MMGHKNIPVSYDIIPDACSFQDWIWRSIHPLLDKHESWATCVHISCKTIEYFFSKDENAWALACLPASLLSVFCTWFNDVLWHHDVILWCHGITWHQGTYLYQILGRSVKWFSRELANRWTDRQTDGTDFIPSTADAGGNKTPCVRKLTQECYAITVKFYLDV